jgi:isoleucyl-tRNA synthetase
MVGWEYDGPFDELPAQGHPSGYPAHVAEAARKQGWVSPKAARENHRVIAWKEVGGEEGTGIVHIAPGCGAEDFELGKEEHLVAVAPLDETGVFLEGFGQLTGRSALDHATTDWILEDLKKKGVLLEVERYPHNYPHCWRCKTELLFRLVDEWFINMNWREEIMEVTRQVTFLPESINGMARELDWLKNMGDWMISKKRFWGLALPIWVCGKCNAFDVIGSRDELKQRAVEGWEKFEGHTPHRPWVDLVKIKCAACGAAASRIADVGNPWLDAGIVPYSTMGYNPYKHNPQSAIRNPKWEEWFPADFITECFPGQFRNWFYAILAMSTMMEHRPPFKVLLGHGLVRDQWGEEMHKAKGNSIPFEGAADGVEVAGQPRPCYVIKHELRPGDRTDVPGALSVKVLEEERDGKKVRVLEAVCPPMSADLMRWMYCRQPPASNINFGPTAAEELHNKFRSKLWNSYRFFCDLARLPVERGGFDVHAPPVPVKDRPDFDRWVLSDLQELIRTAHREFPRFNVMAFCEQAESFVDEKLSNWWVRRNKGRFWEGEPGQSKLAAYQTLHTVLVTLAKLFAPIMPFLTESMYRNLVDGPEDRSVHLCEFPQADEALLDAELSEDMDALLHVKAVGSAARNTVKLKVRQPLAEMKVQPANDRERRAVERFAHLLTDELNIKKVVLHDSAKGPLLRLDIKPNPKGLAPKVGPKLKEVQAALAALSAAEKDTLAGQLQKGEAVDFAWPGGTVTLETADVFIAVAVPDHWAGAADGGTQVAIDTRVTEELKREGQAREVVRQVNEARKQANLNIEDRIALHLATESAALRQAIDAHRDYIGGETLVKEWADKPLDRAAYKTEVKVDGEVLKIELRTI